MSRLIVKDGIIVHEETNAPAFPQPRPSISAERVKEIWLTNSSPLAVWRGRWMDAAEFEKALREAGVDVKEK